MRNTLVVLCALFTLGVFASGQTMTQVASMRLVSETSAASAEIAPAPISTEPVKTTHKFFDRKNIGLSMMTFSAALADGVTTQHALGMHRTRTTTLNGVTSVTSTTYVERNPFAAPLVNRGWAGQMAATALTTGADLSIRGWLHHTGHHRMERIVPFVFAATSASFAAHNAHYW